MATTNQDKAAYKDKKVSELKGTLAELKLSQKGTKSELIQRLVNHYNSVGAEADPEDPAASEEVASETEKTETAAAEAEAEAANVEVEEPKGQNAEAEPTDSAELASTDETATEEPKLTDEERAQKVLDELKVKITRTKKFGGNADELEARLRRLERFGVTSVLDANEMAKAKSVSRMSGRNKRKNRKQPKAN